MDKMTQILDIPSIKNDTNFWMVRAKRGFFFDEFIRNEFIAIGWNSVTKAMISQNLTRSQSDRLKASIKATYSLRRSCQTLALDSSGSIPLKIFQSC